MADWVASSGDIEVSEVEDYCAFGVSSDDLEVGDLEVINVIELDGRPMRARVAGDDLQIGYLEFPGVQDHAAAISRNDLNVAYLDARH